MCAATRRRARRARRSTCACSTNSIASTWCSTRSIGVPKLSVRAAYGKQAIRDKLIEHREYITKHDDDMPEIAGWIWGQGASASSTEGDNV